MGKRASHPGPAPRGFTMVELLVVVAVIAVLMSLLLPALSRTREQGRQIVCINNARSITIAAQAYSQDHNDIWPVFPCKIRVPQRTVLFSSWHYGGKTVSDYWRNHPSGEWQTASERPLNPYLYPETEFKDPPDGRLELPVFKCPSDPGTLQRTWFSGSGYNDTSITSYDDVGTSYHMNVRWWYRACELAGVSPGFNNLHVWQSYQNMFRVATFKYPARFSWMYDQNMDFIAVGGIPHLGDHGGENKATASFMDGHVSYLTVIPKLPETEDYTLFLERRVVPSP